VSVDHNELDVMVHLPKLADQHPLQTVGNAVLFIQSKRGRRVPLWLPSQVTAVFP
jgi:hypothetical protein